MLDEHIEHVASGHGLDISTVRKSAGVSAKRLEKFRHYLARELDNVPVANVDVVVLGSFARSEITNESDCDYLILVDSTPDHHLLPVVTGAVETVRTTLDLGKPGTTGTFGDFVTATELLGRIGLDADSNANTTRRMLVLAESATVLDGDVSDRVRRKILERYCVDYAPPNRESGREIRVPHFLLNDLVRYWRTMAVDFGAKQWRAVQGGWYLRYAKLLTTRKILFAGSLAVLLTTGHALRSSYDAGATAEELHGALVDHLFNELQPSPLARLMRLHDNLQQEGQRALADVLQEYERFLAILDDSAERKALEEVDRYGRTNPGTFAAEVRDRVDCIGEAIDSGLREIFFEDPFLATQTKLFGLF